MIENDTITTKVGETIQNDTTVKAMADTFEKLTSTPISEWLPDLVRQYLSESNCW